jgi:thiol-disulfide isomerase/thioredoxin
LTTTDKLRSFRPLIYAGLMMVVGMMILIYLGQDRARIVGEKIDGIDLIPLLGDADPVSTEDLDDRIVVLHFWGPWCGYCKIEYPEFARVAQKYAANTNVRVLSISSPAGDSETIESLRGDTQAFLRAQSIDMPIYADPVLYTQTQVAMMLPTGGFAFPTTLVLDGENRVRYYFGGMMEDGELDTAIESLL